MVKLEDRLHRRKYFYLDQNLDNAGYIFVRQRCLAFVVKAATEMKRKFNFLNNSESSVIMTEKCSPATIFGNTIAIFYFLKF